MSYRFAGAVLVALAFPVWAQAPETPKLRVSTIPIAGEMRGNLDIWTRLTPKPPTSACLTAFATRHHDVGLTLAGLAAGGFVIGLVWLAVEHRRVRRIEKRWYAEHPETLQQRPSS